MSKYFCPASPLEFRSTALLIGTVQFMWALIPLLDLEDRSLFARVLAANGNEVPWCFSWMAVGLLLIVTSVVPWRSGRFIALFLSASSLFSTFGMFVSYDAGIGITPVTLVLPLFGGFCVVMMFNETARKKRNGQAAHGIS